MKRPRDAATVRGPDNAKGSDVMKQAINVLCTLVRLVRPSGGVHTDPSGYLLTVLSEVRRRSRRVRRYAATPRFVSGTGPLVPAPRRPVDAPLPVVLSTAPVPTDYVPVVDASSVAEPAAMVRGYYREWERRKAERYADRQRLGMAVLCDVAIPA